MNIKVKEQPFWVRFMAAVSAALLLVTSAPVLQAIDIQALANDVRAGNGFTHRARITISDVTNALSHNQWRIFPGTGNGLTGDAIDRVGIYLDTPFWVTNANAGSNAVFLNIGASFATNGLVSQFPVSSNQTQLAFITNAPPFILSAATNFLTASLTWSNSSMPALTSSGDAYIYFRVVRFDRISSP